MDGSATWPAIVDRRKYWRRERESQWEGATSLRLYLVKCTGEWRKEMQCTPTREKRSQLDVGDVGRQDISYRAVQIERCGRRGQTRSM